MNEQDNDELQPQLRGLPRERVPPAHNWQRIEARLTDLPRPLLPKAEPLPTPTRPRIRRRPWMLGAAVAAAACLLVVAGIRQPPTESETHAIAVQESSLQLQADRMAGTYQLAIAALPREPLPAELTPALSELDQSAQVIRNAIAQSPEAGFLLGQLQRTYAFRLELTRQGLLTTAGLPT